MFCRLTASFKTLIFKFRISEILNFQQGSHRLEKYLNLEDSLEKSLKIKYALKVLENHTKMVKSP